VIHGLLNSNATAATPLPCSHHLLANGVQCLHVEKWPPSYTLLKKGTADNHTAHLVGSVSALHLPAPALVPSVGDGLYGSSNLIHCACD
jgi:hypothetical protein